jgi:hypothetical protein
MTRPDGRSGPPPTRRGYPAGEVVSALQKSIRRSDVDAGLYWAFELEKSGYGPWLWKRLRVIASEDVGPAVPGIASEIRALHQNWTEGRGKGGEEVYIAHAVIALAIAKKSRCTDWAVLHHLSDHVERREVPDEALDMHTHRGRRMGRDRRHFMEEGSQLRDWTGSLEDLEAGYCEKVEQLIDHDPVPTNPWGSQSPRGDSTQLELGGES